MMIFEIGNLSLRPNLLQINPPLLLGRRCQILSARRPEGILTEILNQFSDLVRKNAAAVGGALGVYILNPSFTGSPMCASAD